MRLLSVKVEKQSKIKIKIKYISDIPKNHEPKGFSKWRQVLFGSAALIILHLPLSSSVLAESNSRIQIAEINPNSTKTPSFEQQQRVFEFQPKMNKTKSGDKEAKLPIDSESLSNMNPSAILAINLGFLLESAKPLSAEYLTISSLHGRESFMTTNAGIIEDTYRNYQLARGMSKTDLLSIKSITIEQTYEIYVKMYWNKVPELKTLPLAIAAQRFQAIINMGVGRDGSDAGEHWIWQQVKTDFATEKKLTKEAENWSNMSLNDQKRVINLYLKWQLDYYSDLRVKGNEEGGLNNRAHKAHKFALSILNNPNEVIKELNARKIDPTTLAIVLAAIKKNNPREPVTTQISTTQATPYSGQLADPKTALESLKPK